MDYLKRYAKVKGAQFSRNYDPRLDPENPKYDKYFAMAQKKGEQTADPAGATATMPGFGNDTTFQLKQFERDPNADL